jgi:hypothetical protein
LAARQAALKTMGERGEQQNISLDNVVETIVASLKA